MRALKEQLEQRESHWSLAHGHLLKQVESLLRENTKLKGKHGILEHRHLQTRRPHDGSHELNAETVVRMIQIGTLFSLNVSVLSVISLATNKYEYSDKSELFHENNRSNRTTLKLKYYCI